MLDLNTSTDRERELAQVVCQLTNQLQEKAGVDIEALAEQHPEFADELRELLPSMQLLLSMGDGPSKPVVMGTVDTGVPPDLQQLHVLGDFRILRELGRGGMGVVYEAQQVSMGRKVALKVLPFAALAQENSLQRFRNEVRAAGALNHPSIVAIHSVGEERGVHFFAMQLIRGQTMAEVIAQLVHLQNQGQPLHDDSISQALSVAEGSNDDNDVANGSCRRQTADPPRSGERSYSASSQSSQETRRDTQARISTEGGPKRRSAFIRSATRLGVQAAEALQHAHESGVLHRDIKPGNLMLDAEGQLYITDFGLARIESDVGMTMTGDMIGTLRYMSPEQALAKRIVIDHRSDIYSLGVTLYELLTLRPAFEGTDRQELLKQIAFDDPPKPRQISRSIPAELQTIILKAIEKNPDERYNTAGELADDLRAFLENRPIKAKPPTPIQRAAKWSRRHGPLVWSAGVSSALLLVIAVVVLAVSNAMIAQERNQKTAALAARTTALEEKDKALAESQQSFDQALQAVDQMLTRVGEESLVDVPQMRAVRLELLEDAVRFYSTLLQQDPENPIVRYRMALAQVSLGAAISHTERYRYRGEEAEAPFRAAITTLTDLVEEFPSKSEYKSTLGRAYYERAFLHMNISPEGKIATSRKAVEIYKQLSTRYPDEDLYRWDLVRAYALVAGLLNYLGQYSDAAALAHQVIDSFSTSESGGEGERCAVYNVLAKALSGMRSFEEADTAYENAVRYRREQQKDLAPHAEEKKALGHLLKSRGNLLLKLKRYDQAEECFRESADILVLQSQSYPSSYRGHRTVIHTTHRALVDIFKATGQTDALNKLIRDIDPHTAGEYFDRAAIYQHIKEVDKALADYDKAIKIDPNVAAVIRARGNIHLDRRQYEAALSDFSKGIELDANHSYTYKRRGLTHFHLGNFDQALADIAKSGELNPEDTSNLTWISPALVAACPDEAFRDGMLELADKTVELTNGSAGAYAARGALLGALGHKERAIADYDKAIELNPDNALLCNNVAWFTASDSDADPVLVRRAVKLAESAVSLEPRKASYWNTLGVIQYRAADFDAAIESLERSEELSNGDHFGYDGIFIAMAHWQLGHEDESRDWYDRAVDWMEANNPDDEELIRLRAEAEELMGISDIGREP